MKYVFASLALIAVLVIGVWNVGIPEGVIIRLIENSLSDSTLEIEFSGFRKGLFYSFGAEGIEIKRNGRTLVSAEDFSGRMHLLSLLKLKLPFTFSAGIGGGILDGSLDLLGRELSMKVEGVKAGAIPFVEQIGLKGDGSLSGSMGMKENQGDARFDIREMRFSSGTFGSISVPLSDFRSAQCALEMKGGSVKVRSCTMEGPGVYARIKGDIASGKLNLILEIMPEKSFADRNLVFSLLDRYKVSAGYYSVPLTNKLGF